MSRAHVRETGRGKPHGRRLFQPVEAGAGARRLNSGPRCFGVDRALRRTILKQLRLRRPVIGIERGALDPPSAAVATA